MKTIKEIDKDWQFLKLCISLTKQGFKFIKQRGVSNALTFPRVDAKRLYCPYTKLPFVNSLLMISHDKTKICYQFDQWAGR